MRSIIYNFVFMFSFFVFVIHPTWAVEPLIHSKFNEEEFAQSQWSIMAAGFGSYQEATVRNDLIPMSEAHPSYTDGRGVRVTALSGQGSFITGPTIFTGDTLVVLKVSVLAMDGGGTIAMGGLNIPANGTLADMDGSLTYTYQANSDDFMGEYHRIIAVYRAEKQAIIPFFQVAVPSSQEAVSVTVMFDNFQIFPLNQSSVTDPELLSVFDIGEPAVETPTPVLPTMTPTVTPTPTPPQEDTLAGETFQFTEVDLDGDVKMPVVDFDIDSIYGVISADLVNNFQDIYLRHLDKSSNEVVGPYLVNQTFENTVAKDPDIDIGADGTRHIVWTDNRSLEKLYSIFLNQVDSSGQKIFQEDFEVNVLYENTNTKIPAVAVNENGDLVVCWKDNRNVFEDYFGRRFTWDGEQLRTISGGDYLINIPRENTNVYEQDVAIDEAGNILSVWSDDRVKIGNEKRKDIYARYYDMDTTISTEFALPEFLPEIEVSQPDNFLDQAHDPKVAFSNGYFLVVWRNESELSVNESHIFASVIQGGQRIQDEFLIDDGEQANNASNPTVTAWGDAEFVISWYDDRDGTVWARWYDAVDHAYTSDPIILDELSQAPQNVSVASGNAVDILTIWNTALNDASRVLFGFSGFWDLAEGAAKKDVIRTSKVLNQTMSVNLKQATRESLRDVKPVKERKDVSNYSSERN